MSKHVTEDHGPTTVWRHRY